MLKVDPVDRAKLIDPLFRAPSRAFWLMVASLLAVLAAAAVFYVRQLVLGLGETGMNRPTYWGVYMVNFVFFIGISHAGTLISAILRVTGAEWRRPITRVAEAITVIALAVGTLQIIIDMGRPDRLYFVLMHGRLQSPILWDVISVTAYFLGSVFYLYLPVIPDAAILRDNVPENGAQWRRLLYTVLALGWRGTRAQWVRLEKAIAVMAVIIIPVAVSVHTIISWILATTLQPGWHSTIFGPYFVVGAIFSGIGALFLAMTSVRRALGLESYIGLRQYRNLGLLFTAMNAIWAYFTYAENLGIAATQEVDEFPVLATKLWGTFAASFWFMVVLMIIAFWVLVVPRLLPAAAARVPIFRPAFALASAGVAVVGLYVVAGGPTGPMTADISGVSLRTLAWVLLIGFGLLSLLAASPWLREHTVGAAVIASVCVVIGMWLERWNIIVPTMTHARLVPWSIYTPSLTEVALTAGSFAIFGLLFLGFFRIFPAISIWEISEGRVLEKAASQVVIPTPEPTETRPPRRWGIRPRTITSRR